MSATSLTLRRISAKDLVIGVGSDQSVVKQNSGDEVAGISDVQWGDEWETPSCDSVGGGT